jgi:hypothetical protein
MCRAASPSRQPPAGEHNQSLAQASAAGQASAASEFLAVNVPSRQVGPSQAHWGTGNVPSRRPSATVTLPVRSGKIPVGLPHGTAAYPASGILERASACARGRNLKAAAGALHRLVPREKPSSGPG